MSIVFWCLDQLSRIHCLTTSQNAVKNPVCSFNALDSAGFLTDIAHYTNFLTYYDAREHITFFASVVNKFIVRCMIIFELAKTRQKKGVHTRSCIIMSVYLVSAFSNIGSCLKLCWRATISPFRPN